MAIVPMAYATYQGIGSSAEYNKVVDNVTDLDARLGSVTAANNANARLGVLESRTTNASGTTGIGNQALADRLGTGVTTASTATAQFTTLTTRTTDASTGNAALGSRVATLEASSGGALPFIHVANVNTAQSITGSTHANQNWQVLALDTLVEARGGSFDNAGDYITVTSAGLYQAIYSCPFQNTANGKGLRIERYTAGAWGPVKSSAAWLDVVTAAGLWPTALGTKFVRLAAGDRIRMSAFVLSTTSIVREAEATATQDAAGPTLQLLYSAS